MVTVRDLSLALTRYGRNNPSLLRRQDAPKGLSCLLSARIPRTHFAASQVGQAAQLQGMPLLYPSHRNEKRPAVHAGLEPLTSVLLSHFSQGELYGTSEAAQYPPVAKVTGLPVAVRPPVLPTVSAARLMAEPELL